MSEFKHVFTVGKAKIYAGSKDEILRRRGWALLISALGSVTQPDPIKVNDAFGETFPDLSALTVFAPAPMLAIDWPDCGFPMLDEDWWWTLAKALPKIEGKVALFCMGGHGRTGTMLSILAALCKVAPKKADVIDWVRQKYSKEAVESYAQIDYIESITGRQTYSIPSKTFGKTTYGSTQASGTSAQLPLGGHYGDWADDGKKTTTKDDKYDPWWAKETGAGAEDYEATGSAQRLFPEVSATGETLWVNAAGDVVAIDIEDVDFGEEDEQDEVSVDDDEPAAVDDVVQSKLK